MARSLAEQVLVEVRSFDSLDRPDRDDTSQFTNEHWLGFEEDVMPSEFHSMDKQTFVKLVRDTKKAVATFVKQAEAKPLVTGTSDEYELASIVVEYDEPEQQRGSSVPNWSWVWLFKVLYRLNDDVVGPFGEAEPQEKVAAHKDFQKLVERKLAPVIKKLLKKYGMVYLDFGIDG